jgi:hypothetical protein
MGTLNAMRSMPVMQLTFEYRTSSQTFIGDQK